MEKKKLYESIMASVAKEVKKALNENDSDDSDWNESMQRSYLMWKDQNKYFLEKFIKEYLIEHLSTSIYWGSNRLSIGLDIDGKDFGGCSDNDPNYHCGYEE